MIIRDLDKRFLNAMREKLQHGRDRGYHGWDQKWKDTVWPTNNPSGYLLDRLNHEILELAVAMETGTKEQIKQETADVANFAMMIADITGSLDNSPNNH
jgi:hypothetical protein